MRLRRLIDALPLLITGASLFWGGFMLGGHTGRPTGAPPTDRTLQPLVTSLETIKADYFRPLSTTWLEGQALKGAIAALRDPYSHYYDSESWQQFTQALSAAHGFAGIGVALAPNPRGVQIVHVFASSPARRAGLRAGLRILAVDGRSLTGLNAEDAAARIGGPTGTQVSLTVATDRATRVVHLTRARIPDPSVVTRALQDSGARILDIKVLRFAAGTSKLILRALTRAATSGDRGAVLDLRGNTGGLVTEAVATASTLLRPGATIVSLHFGTGVRRTYLAAGDAALAKLPLVELVDHSTISAGEILTGALKDNHRALIVGQRTFGKGVFQELVPLAIGGGLELTTGQCFTPDGRNLGGGGTHEGAGVTPEVQTHTRVLATALTLLSSGAPNTLAN